MSFENTFCSSPWIHMRITNQGYYNFCRWETVKYATTPRVHIRDVTPVDFFQQNMAPIRENIRNGEVLPACRLCNQMEEYNKVSGRQKQLLKTGIVLNNFEKTLLASPYYNEFKKTSRSNLMPVDWQVDLGNHCNGACIFCKPQDSSVLANEFLKNNLIKDKIPTSWCNDPKLLEKFTDTIIHTPNLKYLHFIGGETLITPAFKKILKTLIKHNMTDIAIGFTTNLMVWDDEINDLLVQFETVNLGMSIETMCRVNDYARYPSKISKVRKLLDRWVKFGKEHNWLTQLRITPTWITVENIDEVFEYAYTNGLGVESCNFLDSPKFMRMSVLPCNLRDKAIARLETWINSKPRQNSTTIINSRHPDTLHQQALEDATSYMTYLKNAPYEPELLPELIEFLKVIEPGRNISILNYKPHYAEFLRSNGY
jgi:hypothetical protein